jgi:hypothetical protein
MRMALARLAAAAASDAKTSKTMLIHHSKLRSRAPVRRSWKNVMASPVVLTGTVVKGVGPLDPMALTGLRPDATIQSHQRTRGGGPVR